MRADKDPRELKNCVEDEGGLTEEEEGGKSPAMCVTGTEGPGDPLIVADDDSARRNGGGVGPVTLVIGGGYGTIE